MITIPGTDFPYPVIERKGPPALHSDAERKQRNGLLGKVHVAKKQMRLNDDEYRMILRAFKVASAADLNIPQLENLIKLLKSYGWKPAPSRNPSRTRNEDQVIALRKRCVAAVSGMENGEKRLSGLALKICGTSQLAWCRDARKLERLLAVLGNLKATNKIIEEDNHRGQN